MHEDRDEDGGQDDRVIVNDREGDLAWAPSGAACRARLAPCFHVAGDRPFEDDDGVIDHEP